MVLSLPRAVLWLPAILERSPIRVLLLPRRLLVFPMTVLRLPWRVFLLPRILLLLPWRRFWDPLIWLLFPLMISLLSPKMVLERPKTLLRLPTMVELAPMRELLDPLNLLFTPCIWLLDPWMMLFPAPAVAVAVGLKKSFVEKTLLSWDFWSCPALKVDCMLLKRLVAREGNLGATWMVSGCTDCTMRRRIKRGSEGDECLVCMEGFPKLSFNRIYAAFHRFGNKSCLIFENSISNQGLRQLEDAGFE